MSDLVGNPNCCFPYAEAQFVLMLTRTPRKKIIITIRQEKKRNVSGNPTDPVKNSPTLIFFPVFRK